MKKNLIIIKLKKLVKDAKLMLQIMKRKINKIKKSKEINCLWILIK